MILNCSLLLLILLTFPLSEGKGPTPLNDRCENLKKLIEEKKKVSNSEVADETISKLAEVLAWFDEREFAKEIIEIIFKKPPTTEKQANLSSKQIETVLFDFKVDGAWQSAINAFYSELPSTHQSTPIVEKKVLGKKLNRALKKQLKRGFTLTHTLNEIWNESYKCWQALNHTLKKWKAEQKVGD